MQKLVRNHPAATFGLLATFLSVVALRPLPASIPLVALLVTVRISTQLIVPRPHSVWRIAILWLGLSTGYVISFASAGSAAVRSFIPSIVYSGVFSGLGLIPFLACALLRIRGFAFPAFWSTWWWFVTILSPVGRLGAWSPLSGYEAYAWTRPFAGELAIDWVIGSWCEVLAGFAVAQMMGRVNNEDDAPSVDRGEPMVLPRHNNGANLPANEGTPLLQSSLDDRVHIIQRPRQRVIRPSNQITLITLIILAAALPTAFLNPLPPPLQGDNRRDVGVACVSPILDETHSPFDVFLAETRKVAGRAHVILWPEGAVAFDSEADRKEKLDTVSSMALENGVWVGVAFTEPASSEDESAKGKRRNGIAVVNHDGVVLEYYKRHLVPLVEGFPQVEGKVPPSVVPIKLGSTAHPKHQWNITISTSICLDFAHPSNDFESKPSLILGPARTWHPNVGRVMMEMAKQRAEELGTRVLWCDGGNGGVSGVVGMGESGVHVGHGTWVERLSFEIPIDEKRTVFGTAGAVPGLLFVWALVSANLPTGAALMGPSLLHRAFWVATQGQVMQLLTGRR